MSIVIYTDGAAKGNPGRGGYGVVLLSGVRRKELSGGFRLTTNNRMEIRAVVEGLASLPENSSVTVYTDSMYVINTMTKNWKRNANLDLWKKLESMMTQLNHFLHLSLETGLTQQLSLVS